MRPSKGFAGKGLRRIVAALLVGLSLPYGAGAQDRASLVADTLFMQDNSVLVAQGGVEVFFQGRRLTASRIVYDQAANRLSIEGPIRLSETGGDTVILGSQAELSADLRDGLIESARIVLDNQLQIAAVEAARIGGRYLRLDNAVASSCRVCAASETPLWEIRARRVVKDEVRQQLYFDHAQVRVAGVPVFYIPRLRMPDPKLKRADGFLLPRLSSSTTLGTGIEMPYFLTLGTSRDLTITPFITSDQARSVKLRYRQAFRKGDLTLQGAVAIDQVADGLRGYLFADGSFALPRGYRLGFHGEFASDETFLTNYDITDADRLTSYVDVIRVGRVELAFGKLRGITSLRSDENASTIPALVGDAIWQRRYAALGGHGVLEFSSHGHLRTSTALTDADGDTVPDGRDVARASVGANWRRDWVLGGSGITGAVLGEARIDSFNIAQDSVFAGTDTRLWGAAGVELRWPWARVGKDGLRDILEPVIQIVGAGASDAAIPNEDSVLVEFDEASLLSLNRYPGFDAVETGAHANIALSWTRLSPQGWTTGLTLGRVIRAEDASQDFSLASGLGGTVSDWLVSARLQTAGGLVAAGRVIADDDLNVARGEMQLSYAQKTYSLGAGYIWSIADAAEFRAEDVSELALNGGYALNDYWKLTANGRYNVAANLPNRAGIGLSFRNECVLLDLSLSRRFAQSTKVTADTKFGVTLELTGFGGSTRGGAARTCQR